ncbi:MAG: hypothetical protein AAB512_00735 [Patescibacteria group bacterium]
MDRERFSRGKLKKDFVNIVSGRLKRLFSMEEWDSIMGHLKTDRAVVVRFHSDSEKNVMWGLYSSKGRTERFSQQYVLGGDRPEEFGNYPVINKELGVVDES